MLAAAKLGPVPPAIAGRQCCPDAAKAAIGTLSVWTISYFTGLQYLVATVGDVGVSAA